jgi:small subunit ribosomal protein S4
MKRQRKKYKSPVKAWDKGRIEKERVIVKSFGLRKKRDIWRAEALLRKYRRIARKLAAKKDKEQEKVLVKKLAKLGLLNENSGLDDVLTLTLENLLERRLQTIIFRKGFTNSTKQARQFITHGHVRINGKKVVYPSYLVLKDEESNIGIDVQPVRSAKAVAVELPKKGEAAS